MFRKMTLDQLPVEDCHSIVREHIVQDLRSRNPGIKMAPLCFSVAWDWYVVLH